MPRGGRRPGAGRKREPFDTPARERLRRKIEKDVLREQARRIIAPALAPLLKAQIANAIGLKYLVTRDKKTGKFIRVTEAMARQKQAAAQGGDADALETIEVWEKDPSVHAFAELLNRLLDKPKEQEQEIRVRTDEQPLIEKVTEARQRVANLRRASHS